MFENNKSKIKYADIIDMPHHVSLKRPHMPMTDRAAQFAPFAALTGHDAAVKETARLTEEQVQLDESRAVEIDRSLQELLRGHLGDHTVSITYFVKDERKTGGAYRTVSGPVKRVLQYESLIIMNDGTEIPVKNIVNIEIKKI